MDLVAQIAEKYLGRNATSLKGNTRDDLPMNAGVPSNICCANSVSAVLTEAGQLPGNLHTDSVAQLNSTLRSRGWTPVPASQAKPGDVVIIQGDGVSHTEIISGPGQMIGSNNTNADGSQQIGHGNLSRALSHGAVILRALAGPGGPAPSGTGSHHRRHRVALALPGTSHLYRSAEGSSRIALGAFDLAEGVDSWADRLAAFAPDTIVAPPKVLRLLAERGALGAKTLFSAAEVLDPLDRTAIEAATGARVRQIYMATEGLFGVSCAHGTLHLAEDVVHFGWEPAAPGSDLVQPIVTDFTRRAQAMARYRMNDLLLLDDAPCRCGSALRAVRRIEGRRDDIFWFADGQGALHPVTADVLRNALLDADRRIDDFRIVQTGASAISVHLCDGQGEDARVRAAFAQLADRMALAPLSIAIVRGIAVPFDVKLRRVRREWSPDQSNAIVS